MTCHHAEHLINAVLDGELATPQMRGLFQHLGDCEPCRTFYRDHQRVITMVNRANDMRPMPQPPGSLHLPGSLSRGSDWTQQKVEARPASLLLAAFAAFMLGMGFMLGLVSLDRLGHGDANSEGAGQGSALYAPWTGGSGHSFSSPVKAK
jgi:predicted anti-sigma-YlaC factor YlaD